MNRLPVILDTDPGLGEPGSDIDDGLAIALAILSPEIELLGLTIVNGNVDTATGVDVASPTVNAIASQYRRLISPPQYRLASPKSPSYCHLRLPG